MQYINAAGVLLLINAGGENFLPKYKRIYTTIPESFRSYPVQLIFPSCS